MPKPFLTRYTLIIKRLEKSPATFKEIQSWLQRESELQQEDFNISLRTFQRDIQDIYNRFNYEIVNEKTGDKRYYIKETPEQKEHSHRLLESLQITNAINAAAKHNKHIFLETRQPKGLEHFNGLLYAIQNKLITSFKHYKYWDETITNRTVHPLALKESQGRWYLLATDTKDKKLKTFGLDRMDELEITKAVFKESHYYDFNEMFSNLFGILSSDDKPQNIQLAFTYEQGRYVKNYPLHHSQKVIKENKSQIIVQLCLAITYDFIQEILHFGEEVKVLQPLDLIKQIKQIAKGIYSKY